MFRELEKKKRIELLVNFEGEEEELENRRRRTQHLYTRYTIKLLEKFLLEKFEETEYSTK